MPWRGSPPGSTSAGLDGLLAVARARSVDLIVVGTHGATGLERLILGSVADKIIRGANQPVLVIPLATPAEPRPEPG
jgi:nucleotide-binding universal stress UspA family protein